MNDSNDIDLERIKRDSFVSAVEHYDTLKSTQERAQTIAQNPETASKLPLLIIADEQTAGRGRGGNVWWTGRGSLAFSLLYDPVLFGLSHRPLPQASLAAGVALIDAVSAYVDLHMVGLHWPNDVFVSGRKLAGILIDVLPGGQHILGIGLNANNNFSAAPAEVRERATSLIQLVGRALDRTDVLLNVLRHLDLALRQLASNPEAFGRRFDERCGQIGHDLTIETAGRRTTGRCAGIATDGALILDTLSGRQTFYSGVLR